MWQPSLAPSPPSRLTLPPPRSTSFAVIAGPPSPPPVALPLRPAVPQPGPPLPTPIQPPPPLKATNAYFATVAGSGPPPSSRQAQQWTTTTKKAAKAKAAPLITPGYTNVNRELIVKLYAPVPDSLTTDTILETVNTTLTSPDT